MSDNGPKNRQRRVELDEISVLIIQQESVRAMEMPIPTKSQPEIDVSNLRFYARLFREQKWETNVISWTVFEQTLNEVAERIAKVENENAHLNFALNRVWEVASGESQVAMDDTQGMEYLSDYVSSVSDEIHQGKELASVPDPTSKLEQLEQQIQAQQEEIEKLRRESDKWMVDFGMECAKTNDLELQISTLQATVTRLTPKPRERNLNDPNDLSNAY